MTSMRRQSKMPLSSFLSSKWTKHQLDNLQSIVLSIRPNSISGWRKVCVKMHEIGSRKTCTEYKIPGDVILAKKQRIQIKLSREQIRNLFQKFGQGSSLPQLTQKYGYIMTNMRRVRQMITKKLKLISMVMRWTIGRRNIRCLSIRDHRLFRFIRDRKLDFVNFNQVADRCERYRAIQKLKDEDYRKERHQIRLYLNRFNGFLKAYSKIYEDAQKPVLNRVQYQPHQRIVNIPTIPYLHLAKMLQQNLLMQEQQEVNSSYNQMDLQDKHNGLHKMQTGIDLCIQMMSQNESSLISRQKFIQGLEYV